MATTYDVIVCVEDAFTCKRGSMHKITVRSKLFQKLETLGYEASSMHFKGCEYTIPCTSLAHQKQVIAALHNVSLDCCSKPMYAAPEFTLATHPNWFYDGMTITAAGVILTYNNTHVLLGKKQNDNWSHFGGRKKHGLDNTPLDTALREFNEETYHAWHWVPIAEHVTGHAQARAIYLPDCKQVVHVVQVPDLCNVQDLQQACNACTEYKEMIDFAWFTIAQAKQLQLSVETKYLLQHL